MARQKDIEKWRTRARNAEAALSTHAKVIELTVRNERGETTTSALYVRHGEKQAIKLRGIRVLPSLDPTQPPLVEGTDIEVEVSWQ